MLKISLIPVIFLSFTAPALPQVPLSQEQFSVVVKSVKSGYKSASTEIQKTNMRETRREMLCMNKFDSVQDWYGTVLQVRSTSDGRAAIDIKMDGFSLRGMTFVSKSDPIYTVLASLNKQDRVAFHGKFYPDPKDCFREMSVTENGSVMDPEFSFDVTSIIRY